MWEHRAKCINHQYHIQRRRWNQLVLKNSWNLRIMSLKPQIWSLVERINRQHWINNLTKLFQQFTKFDSRLIQALKIIHSLHLAQWSESILRTGFSLESNRRKRNKSWLLKFRSLTSSTTVFWETIYMREQAENGMIEIREALTQRIMLRFQMKVEL